MKESFLLDTHTLLWFFEGNESLSKEALNKIKLTSNRCFVSIVSLWEMAIKINLGKLKLEIDFKTFGAILHKNDIEILQITFEHLLVLMSLEDHHRDPFDRIIISQAKHEGIPIITTDSFIREYKDITVVW